MGPLLRCRLNTAVRWEWDPVTRRSWSASAIGVAAMLVGVLLLAVSPAAATVVLGALGAVAALEAVVLRRSTAQAVARTTAGVGVPA